MASSGTIVCIIYAFGITVGVANSSLKLECDETNTGQFGQQSLLKCVIKQPAVKVRVVIWRKVGENEEALLVFEDTVKKQVQGFRFVEPFWITNNPDLSMLINNTKMEDEGEYLCTVVTDAGEGEKITQLKVKARYNQPTIKQTKKTKTSNVASYLICESFGGYPEGELRWFDEHDKDWTKSSNMTVKKTDNGLFKLSSWLPLMSGSTYESYTCKVYDGKGVEEGKVFFEPNKQTDPEASVNNEELKKETSPAAFVAPVVVIGSVIVGLLLLLLYRRQSQKMRRPSTAPLMGPHESVEIQDPDVETGDPEYEVEYKNQP
ncbi:uncharacterized protein LOC101156630 isoform X1 [Oryzias latipes]|uniref:uncharacterized protein LOC101156630 isoform X1 n=1 Tax=Oryzias latipes TaxID=8090 RepID=UPI0005CC72CA|nr:uncharacterized protein LOC101156630 isoform X1 [Oryzias latipes]